MSEEQTISNAFICSLPTLGSNNNPPVLKKKRNLPGNPDPKAEVVALSPKTLMATNRFLCDICGKGFQRDQNLQLHRRGHNLPWKLKQRSNSNKEPRKRVYVCPEKSCVHHHPSRALGDLTGIKKHFCRKHGEKKWKCEKCSKKYAVQSDWKAHSKTCGTKEYKCDCGTPFSRRDSYVTHRAYCMALAEETARLNAAASTMNTADNGYHFLRPNTNPHQYFPSSTFFRQDHENSQMFLNNNVNSLTPTIAFPFWMPNSSPQDNNFHHPLAPPPLPPPPPPPPPTATTSCLLSVPSLYSHEEQANQAMASSSAAANMSATVLLQKAAEMAVTSSTTTDPSSLMASFGLKFSATTDGKALFSGLYGSMNSNSIPSCCSLENGGDHQDSAASNLIQMYPAAKRIRHTVSEESVTGGEGETRDFLGVGIPTICHHPSAVNGWM
ncbi:zinc finger protein NUTCRACKER [Cucurbita pepo subsp. pepo]|uniref:zinc finger protein NUTCRACKER n=1 Tax=Cucurbita pepo subsp. pepo TaxID=3664 RepID=UPI000C9D8C57|nr:zinc finger protein NUTCRACKER [Cucurbita pepo subsp. pepo]